jgi:hypothetical protein
VSSETQSVAQRAVAAKRKIRSACNKSPPAGRDIATLTCVLELPLWQMERLAEVLEIYRVYRRGDK